MKAYAGLWYRYRDALAPLVGVEVNDYRILLSYDINISTLRTATQGRGGLELSLVHVGSFNKLNKSSINCPRF
ncbi:MAG: type IX secretion system membrane protein PorP/SprF [Sphingobacteriales bacterium]|nr:type IX secretion system membrane protein PorP/SprF [Sphingobacteriales bacterium]